MTDENYNIAICQIMKSGRAYQAIIDLTGYLKNYNDNVNTAISEYKSERKAVKKICNDPKSTQKEKLQAVMSMIGEE